MLTNIVYSPFYHFNIVVNINPCHNFNTCRFHSFLYCINVRFVFIKRCAICVSQSLSLISKEFRKVLTLPYRFFFLLFSLMHSQIYLFFIFLMVLIGSLISSEPISFFCASFAKLKYILANSSSLLTFQTDIQETHLR